MISDDAAGTQAGCSQKTIDGPRLGIGMFGYGSEDTPCDAPNIARSKMLGEHCSDDLVAGFATDGGGVFGASENRMRAEEGSRYEPGHNDLSIVLENPL